MKLKTNLKNIEIEITQTDHPLDIDTRQLRRTANHVIEQSSCTSAAVSLVIVNNHTITQLQKEYFNQPEPTDVLSFDLRDNLHDDTALDCEIIINAQRALEVAQAQNLDPLAELNLYLVHGLLHQLDCDDQTPREAKAMHKKEDQLLQQLGFGKVFQTGDHQKH